MTPRKPTRDAGELLVKVDEPSSPGRGVRPEDRPIDQLLDDGLIYLDKPDGYVSHDLAAMVKVMFSGTQVTKIGHGGTLDPSVTGVLPLALNHATRIQDVLLSGTKEYVGIMHVHGDMDEARLREVAKTFVGAINQIPPDRSAIKRAPRVRRIDYLDLLEIDGRDVLFKAGCEAGTYIRTLCVDIGKVLGCGAHLTKLRRTRSGCFSENDKGFATLQVLENAIRGWLEKHDPTLLAGLLHPVERAFGHFKRVIVRDAAVRAICRGQGVRGDDVAALDHGLDTGDPVAIFTHEGEIIARGKAMVTSKQAMQASHEFIARTVKTYMIPSNP